MRDAYPNGMANLLLLASVLSIPLLGCITSEDSSVAPQADGSGKADDSTNSVGSVYKFRDDDAEADVYVRLARNGAAISGRFVYYAAALAGGPALPLGTIAGDVANDGTYRLTLTLTGPFGAVWRFVGKPMAENLEGTLTQAEGSTRPVSLARVKAGTMVDGLPLVSKYQEVTPESPQSPCQLEVHGTEVLGLARPAAEARLNEVWIAAFDEAASKCTTGSTKVQGGVQLWGLRPNVLSYVVNYKVFGAVTTRTTSRMVVDLATGTPLRLFGDVLEPGAETQLLQISDQVIDGASFPTNVDRVAFKQAVHAVVESGNTDGNFAMNDRGLVLAAADFNDLWTTSIVIPYGMLSELRVSTGPATEFWTP